MEEGGKDMGSHSIVEGSELESVAGRAVEVRVSQSDVWGGRGVSLR